MNKYIITTQRLGLRNWTLSDINPMTEISADPEVMRYFPFTRNKEQTTSFIQKMQELFDEKKYCYFAVDILETQEFIGFIGLCYQDYEVEFAPFVDIGWRLKPSVWGKGYAPEGAAACLKYGFEIIGLEKIYAVATKNNLPSIRVMEKIDMRREKEFIHPYMKDNEKLRWCVLYSLEK